MVNTTLCPPPNLRLGGLARHRQTVKERRNINTLTATKDADKMAQKASRPLSPHLQIYRWSPQMAISIFHRATGFVMATAGMLTLLWWLSSIGGSADGFSTFQKYVVSAGDDASAWQIASNWFFRLLGLAVVWSFFQHMFSGIRHLVLDIGAGYELKTNKTWASVAFIAALFATALVTLLVASRFIGV
jgi:succinate dehydrogenase / fumarate reductase, cytochrome b subunit